MTSNDIPEPLRDLLAAISDTLELPAADINPADQRRYVWQLQDRVRFVQGAIRDVLTGAATLGIQWEADYLRRKIAENPPTYQSLPSEDATEGAGR